MSLRIFISSVQKELELERAAVASFPIAQHLFEHDRRGHGDRPDAASVSAPLRSSLDLAIAAYSLQFKG